MTFIIRTPIPSITTGHTQLAETLITANIAKVPVAVGAMASSATVVSTLTTQDVQWSLVNS